MRAAHPHRHRFPSLLVPLTCAVGLALGCSITEPGGRTVESIDLARNRQLWANARLHDYEFDYERSCFCPAEETEQVHITVRGDAIVSVVRTRDGAPVAATYSNWPRVDELFTDVQRRIEQRAARIEVAYDPTLGYPRSIVVDVMLMAVDDESDQRASNLRRLR